MLERRESGGTAAASVEPGGIRNVESCAHQKPLDAAACGPCVPDAGRRLRRARRRRREQRSSRQFGCLHAQPVEADHFVPSTPDNVTWGWFPIDKEPVLRVQSGRPFA